MMHNNKKRSYNQLVADETIEDYSLRYAPKSFRKWSEFTIANTAIGSISFLALEAIGASIAFHYGFSTAFWAILTASLIIFITAIPISYHAAKYNIDIDLITRSAGFGYVGSTFTSLIYASFSFIFFALEAAIMAQALLLYFSIPLSLGYLLSSFVILPIVFYGFTLIHKLQILTQPIWLIMMVAPYIAILYKEPQALEVFTSFRGDISASSSFNLYYFGVAIGISLSLIAQIGEQVDYLRFMPPLTKENKFKWWISLLSAGPGWIIIGFFKQIGGIFLASIVLLGGYSVAAAKTPIEMYHIGYTYILDNPSLSLTAATIFVLISQIKINVTNAYAGSLAWSNFFSRITHSHPGRVVWMVFNIVIALVLMELGVFNVLDKVLGLYSNVAIAWIGAIFADLVINKPLGLAPKVIEFKRAYLYNINPVGVGSMGIASFTAIIAFIGYFGEWAQSYSAIIALLLAIILSPAIAFLTKGKYYIARENTTKNSTKHHLNCAICNHTYEVEDMAYCPFHECNICSLCCSLDALCHDSCKEQTEKSLLEKMALFFTTTSRGMLSIHTNIKIINFSLIAVSLFFLTWITGWMIYSMQESSIPQVSKELFRQSIENYSIIIGLITTAITFWIILILDSKQRAEMEYKRVQQKLQDEKIYLRIAKQKAEENTRLKSEFLANMSHEIRTPMNAILGMNYLALQDKDISDKQKNYLKKIESSAKNLLTIINDVLDLSKIEAGKLHLEKINFDLCRLEDDLKNLVELKAQEKGLEFKIVCPHTDDNSILFGDPTRLLQILINLVNNAIKFTHKGSVILYVSILENDTIRFEIKDTGIGLSKEQQSKLFQAFTQADGSTTRKYGGTGLGLSISKQLVELLGGKIWIESKVNSGSSFIFEIPLQKGDPSKISQEEFPPQNLDILSIQGSTILLAEDNLLNQEIIVGLLKPNNINIELANNGSQAVEMYKKNPKKYELILMDLQMPIMDGYEATSCIREMDKNIPIVALTANAMKEDVKRTQEIGMQEHLRKPIEIEKLFSTLLHYIPKKVDITMTTVQTANTKDINIPKFKHIDTKYGLKMMAGNSELYLKILHDFYHNYKNIKLENLNDKELEITSHTIKGLSANIGAESLSKIAQEIEKNKERTLFSDFYQELNVIMEELKILDKEKKSYNENAILLDSHKREELFHQLKELIPSHRMKKIQSVVSEINTYLLSKEDTKKLEMIQKLLSQRKYKDALDILS